MLVRLLRHRVETEDLLRTLPPTPQHETLYQGPGIKSLWVKPVPELIHGDIITWASVNGVEPVRIPGYWLDKEGFDTPVGQSLQSCEKILYRLHGGGYVILSARPDVPEAGITKDLLRFCKPFRRAFSIEYRLSSGQPLPPSNPFPAALYDALAGWSYLTRDLGIPPSDIYITGDSAGGNLALALVRYLVESQARHPAGEHHDPVYSAPGGLILFSPWSDMGTSHDGPRTSKGMHYLSDMLPRKSGYGEAAFTAALGLGATNTNAYMSPASHALSPSFAGFPRTYVCTGSGENLVDEGRTLKKRMERDIGNDFATGVVYDEKPDAIHVFVAFPFHEPERTETYQAISKWVGNEG